MSSVIEVKVPDIGDFSDVPVIEVMVRPGDVVAKEDSLITLESDKATMEVPSPAAGVVRELRVKVGDKVSQGQPILALEPAASAGAAAQPASPPAAPAAARESAAGTPAAAAPATAPAPAAQASARTPAAAPPAAATERPRAGAGGSVEVKVPDIGDFKDVPVIEVLVEAGDRLAAGDSLITLESDKATMEVPSTAPGVVREVRLKVGDRVSEGSVIVVLDAPADAGRAVPEEGKRAKGIETPVAEPARAPASAPAQAAAGAAPPPEGPAAPAAVDHEAFKRAHASPSVRRFARELGVDLALVTGTGPHERILREDVENHVKAVMSGKAAASPAAAAPGETGAALGVIAWPKVDFAKFGPVENQPLTRIRRISGPVLHRNWVMIPHVTNHEDADVTELEALRVKLNEENAKTGNRLTLLAFIVKACVAALQEFPEFNASLDGENVVLKRYWNIGVAADTPNGLVVPVVKDADKKGVFAIAKEMGELAAKAREGKLAPGDMQGGTFSISSLGGIGGTYFTPIINAPEVAILGVCRASMRPVWDGKQFAPRLVLPLSLSWDHRVVDGAAAARFNAHLAQLLADFRRVLL